MTDSNSDSRPSGEQVIDATNDGEGSAEQDQIPYLQIDPRNINAEIERLQRENQDFNRILNAKLGTIAASRYKPEIETLQRKLEEQDREVFKAQVSRMSQEDVQKKYQSDPEFARQYTDAVHPKSEPSAVDETPIITQAFNDALDWGRAQGLEDGTINEVVERAQQGYYGGEDVHWSLSIQRLQTDLMDRVLKKPATKEQPKVNPNLAKKGPDLTPNGGGGSSLKIPKTAAEFNALPQSTQMEILSTQEGKNTVRSLAAK